jgi:hypothetical protein
MAHLTRNEKKRFEIIFTRQICANEKSFINEMTIQKLLALLELELVMDSNRNIVSNKEELKNFYMIKQGSVK